MSTEPDQRVDALKRFIAGGVSGSIAKTVVAPLDRAKILFQVTDRHFSYANAFKELQRIVVYEGPRALLKGNSATILRVLPYSGIQLSSFDIYKRSILQMRGQAVDGRLAGKDKVLAGAMAGATSVMATYPLDLMRARLAVQRRTRKYTGIVNAFRTMVQEEGLRSLYRGLAPTMLGILPYAGLSFFTFESLKQIVCDAQDKQSTGAFEKLVCGGVAGLVGQSASYPLDVVRRRMQTSSFLVDLHALTEARQRAEARIPTSTIGEMGKVETIAKHPLPPRAEQLHAPMTQPIGQFGNIPAVHKAGDDGGKPRKLRLLPSQRLAAKGGSVFSVIVEMVNKEGWRSLFKGLTMNWVKGPMAVAISFTSYDYLKQLLDIPET